MAKLLRKIFKEKKPSPPSPAPAKKAAPRQGKVLTAEGWRRLMMGRKKP